MTPQIGSRNLSLMTNGGFPDPRSSVYKAPIVPKGKKGGKKKKKKKKKK